MSVEIGSRPYSGSQSIIDTAGKDLVWFWVEVCIESEKKQDCYYLGARFSCFLQTGFNRPIIFRGKSAILKSTWFNRWTEKAVNGCMRPRQTTTGSPCPRNDRKR